MVAASDQKLNWIEEINAKFGYFSRSNNHSHSAPIARGRLRGAWRKGCCISFWNGFPGPRRKRWSFKSREHQLNLEKRTKIAPVVMAWWYRCRYDDPNAGRMTRWFRCRYDDPKDERRRCDAWRKNDAGRHMVNLVDWLTEGLNVWMCSPPQIGLHT